MARFQIVQVNIGRIKAALDDPMMAGFVNRLDEINALGGWPAQLEGAPFNRALCD